jgi:hypothetical protein
MKPRSAGRLHVGPRRTEGRQIMNRTVLRSFAILSLWSCLSTQPLIGALGTAQAAGTKSTGTPLVIDVNDLFQHWVHSSEEERPDETVRIYRPAASMKFPPSRHRMAYKFAPNGACEFYFLSPDDAHHFKPCNWTISARDKTILQISANGKTISYRIVQLTGKILRLTPLEPQRNQ